MSDRLVITIETDGTASVRATRAGTTMSSPAESFTLAWPLDANSAEDLRWYLEDYLRSPYGAYLERANQVEARMSAWGNAVFESVFASEQARSAYGFVRDRGVNFEVVVQSPEPSLLGLPWELMADPADRAPLAVNGGGITRSLPSDRLRSVSVPGELLRILVVISRPIGLSNPRYRTIARSLLSSGEAARGLVEVVVLRPPTLKCLSDTLRQAAEQGRNFQMVHFDGHGTVTSRSPGRLDDAVSSFLAFEDPSGGPTWVPAGEFAAVLQEANVAVVVLNACQSGAVGTELDEAVATRLIRDGTPAVVAMGYVVYAAGAAEFMAGFYERLFAGDSITSAVAQGRCRMRNNPYRPSRRGQLALADWVVPVHFTSADVRFPQLRPSPEGEPRSDANEGHEQLPPSEEAAISAAAETMVDRDGLVQDLEFAMRRHRVVLMHGPAGTGKTELAKALGRWWRDTGDVEHPNDVVMHSFAPGIATFGLDSVVGGIASQAFEDEPDPDRRRQKVEERLDRHRMLLIWDNFESVYTMPDPSAGELPAAERDELLGFLASRRAAGHSSVIITSRTDEEWLGDAVHRIAIGGLTADEADEFADALLTPTPEAASRRADSSFVELLDWLDGHPLSMRLVLPHLATTDPMQLLVALQGLGKLPDAGQEGPATSHAASIALSFAHLDPDAHDLLAAVCLFHGVVNLDVLAAFSQVEDVPERFRSAIRSDWKVALDRATRVGLLTVGDMDSYRLHPALPAYLAERWRTASPDTYLLEREAATDALVTAYAQFARSLSAEIRGGDASRGLAMVASQRRNLGYVFRLALEAGLWSLAEDIVRPLDDYWDSKGLLTEPDIWVSRARLALEAPDGTPPIPDTPAGALWLLLVGSQALRQSLLGQLAAADSKFCDILAAMERAPVSDYQQRNIAASYQNRGLVALQRALNSGPRREHLAGAKEYFLRSLEIKERMGDRVGMATSYHQLGIVAQESSEFDEAERLYHLSLAIEDERGNERGIAQSCQVLGMLHRDANSLKLAESWLIRSLRIFERLDDRQGLAGIYHELGILAERKDSIGQAQNWHRRSLRLEEELGNGPGIATSYESLGRLAESQGNAEDAERWYDAARRIEQE